MISDPELSEVSRNAKQLGLWPEDHFDLKYRNDDWVVLSLQPGPWNAIKSGIKKFEYRRRFRARPTIAYIYVSSPISEVCGLIVFDAAVQGTASEIAAIAEEQIPGNGKPVQDYLERGNHGFAIPVKEVFVFDTFSLPQLRDRCHFVAPQLYISLHNNKALWQVLSEATPVEVLEALNRKSG